MFRMLALIAGMIAVGGLGFLAASKLLDAWSGGTTSGVAEETLCEIELGIERCPGKPDFGPARATRVFFDTWESADKNPDRCMRRATEFAAFCRSTQPVTARFFRGSQLVRSETWRR